MIISEITPEDCRGVLARGSIARLGCCLDDQPYIMPLLYAYEPDHIYVFSTFGRKIEWMRANPKVCVQVDEIASGSEWVSVIGYGTYEELAEPQGSVQHARKILEEKHEWWLNALAERRVRVSDLSIETLFLRIHMDSMTGLRATNHTDAAR